METSPATVTAVRNGPAPAMGPLEMTATTMLTPSPPAIPTSLLPTSPPPTPMPPPTSPVPAPTSSLPTPRPPVSHVCFFFPFH